METGLKMEQRGNWAGIGEAWRGENPSRMEVETGARGVGRDQGVKQALGAMQWSGWGWAGEPAEALETEEEVGGKSRVSCLYPT